MAVSKRTRYEVLNRDGFACRYCHETDVALTLDHVIPVALGGSDKPDNLVAACQPCNAGKASTNPDGQTVEQVTDDALRWAGAMKKAAEIIAARDRDADEFVTVLIDNWGDRWLPNDFAQTIHQLRAAGLTRDMLIDSIYIAQTAYGVDNRFRYFCGVCWRKLRELQDVARQLIEEATD